MSNSRQGVIGTNDEAFGEPAAEAVNTTLPPNNTATTAPTAAHRERANKRANNSVPPSLRAARLRRTRRRYISKHEALLGGRGGVAKSDLQCGRWAIPSGWPIERSKLGRNVGVSRERAVRLDAVRDEHPVDMSGHDLRVTAGGLPGPGDRAAVLEPGGALAALASTPTGTPETVALDAGTATALRAWKVHQTEERLLMGAGWQGTRDLIVTEPDGSPVHPQVLTRRFTAIAKAAKLPAIRLHDVRHSYATAALSAGVPVKVMSTRLGQADIGTTLRIYAHVLPGDDEAAADLVAASVLRK